MVTTVFYIEGLLGQSKRTECIHHDRQFGSFGLADRAFVGAGVRASEECRQGARSNRPVIFPFGS